MIEKGCAVLFKSGNEDTSGVYRSSIPLVHCSLVSRPSRYNELCGNVPRGYYAPGRVLGPVHLWLLNPTLLSCIVVMIIYSLSFEEWRNQKTTLTLGFILHSVGFKLSIIHSLFHSEKLCGLSAFYVPPYALLFAFLYFRN